MGVWGVVMFVLSVMRVVGGFPLWVVCVFRRINILGAVFCVSCSLLMFVSDASGDQMVETYSSMGLVMALYVARIVSVGFPNVVDVSALNMSICIVLNVFVVIYVLYIEYP